MPNMSLEEAALKFGAVARALRDAGSDSGLRQRLYRNITNATLPANRMVRAGLPAFMPNRYAGVVASDLSMPVSKLLGRNPGVRIRAISPGRNRSYYRLDTGVLAHPLFGDRKRWYYQGPAGGGMKPGFFTLPMLSQQPYMAQACIDAINETEQAIIDGS